MPNNIFLTYPTDAHPSNGLFALVLFIIGIVLAAAPDEIVKNATDPEKRRKQIRIIAVVLLVLSVLITLGLVFNVIDN